MTKFFIETEYTEENGEWGIEGRWITGSRNAAIAAAKEEALWEHTLNVAVYENDCCVFGVAGSFVWANEQDAHVQAWIEARDSEFDAAMEASGETPVWGSYSAY